MILTAAEKTHDIPPARHLHTHVQGNGYVGRIWENPFHLIKTTLDTLHDLRRLRPSCAAVSKAVEENDRGGMFAFGIEDEWRRPTNGCHFCRDGIELSFVGVCVETESCHYEL